MSDINLFPSLADLPWAWLTLVLLVLGTASYRFKNEAIRGLGRAVLGLFVIVMAASAKLHVEFALWMVLVMYACGAFTIFVGLRKFRRRNLPSS